MQPARIKLHAKEHTNNPVQRPNFRGHAAGDVEVTRACGRHHPRLRGLLGGLRRSTVPPIGAENLGADTLPGKGNTEVLRGKHPRGRMDELQRAVLKTLQASGD